jgi:uncharacterized protein YwqG
MYILSIDLLTLVIFSFINLKKFTAEYEKIFEKDGIIKSEFPLIYDTYEKSCQLQLYIHPHFITFEGNDQLVVGESRIGGVPDLPDDIEWPQASGLSQSFLAQINLKDLASQNFNCVQGVLPSEGWLFFFMDFDDPKVSYYNISIIESNYITLIGILLEW